MRTSLIIALVAAVSLFVLHACWILLHGYNVPYSDEWNAIVEGLANLQAGRLHPFEWAFRDHNGHRIVLTKVCACLIWLILGEYNPVVSMLLGASFLALAVGLLVFSLREKNFPLWSIVTVALFFMTPAQHENIFWGFQTQIYGALAFFVAALITERTGFQILFSALSTLSMGSGILAWPAVAIKNTFLSGSSRKTLIYVCAGTLVLALHLSTLDAAGPRIVDAVFDESFWLWILLAAVYPLDTSFSSLSVHLSIAAVVAAHLLLWCALLLSLYLFWAGFVVLAALFRHHVPFISSRYVTYLLLGSAWLALSAAIVLGPSSNSRVPAKLLAASLLIAVAGGAGVRAWEGWKEALFFSRQRFYMLQNVDLYVRAGKVTRSKSDIPYPDPEYLFAILRMKPIQDLLPYRHMRLEIPPGTEPLDGARKTVSKTFPVVPLQSFDCYALRQSSPVESLHLVTAAFRASGIAGDSIIIPVAEKEGDISLLEQQPRESRVDLERHVMGRWIIATAFLRPGRTYSVSAEVTRPSGPDGRSFVCDPLVTSHITRLFESLRPLL